MQKYDTIVVGSGVSGMTLAVLLGMNDRKVLLLEKAPKIGGSLARFYKEGVPLDTGFHFTGAFGNDGLLDDMLKIMQIEKDIKPVFFEKDAQKVIFEKEGFEFSVPQGHGPLSAKLESTFPNDRNGIKRFFALVRKVRNATVGMDLRSLNMAPTMLDEDYVSLEQLLDELVGDPILKGILGTLCMCHGVAPKEISFANHARVCDGLIQNVSRVVDGGDAFVRAFRKRMKNLDIDVRRKTFIQRCEDIERRRVGRFILNTGEEVACDQCIFTIHPKAILETLPKTHLRPAFVNRILDFEPSAGFFAVFGVLSDQDETTPFGPSIVSLFPTADLNLLLDPQYRGRPAMVVMCHEEKAKTNTHRIVDTLAVSFPQHVAQWVNTKTGHRPEDYYRYKQEQESQLKQRLLAHYPEFAAGYRVLDSASVLTYRDYLHSPMGSAYGIKQKLGQINLFGQMPLRNLYAAGQSSVLPGLLGSMLSSFVVSRAIVGKNEYHEFVEKRLPK